MKRCITYVLLFIGIIALFTNTRAENVSMSNDIPVYYIKSVSILSKEDMEQFLIAFYGDDYKSMKLSEDVYNQKKLGHWRNDKLGYIANFRSSGFRLTKDSDFTIINTNMAGGYRDELQWYANEGIYTYNEAFDMANQFISSFEILRNMSMALSHVYYEDPSLTKERCNYYSFYFVPSFCGIPLADGSENLDFDGAYKLFYLRIDVTNEGIVCVESSNLPIVCVSTVRSINVIDNSKINLESVKNDINQEIIRFIYHPTNEDLSLASERLFYDKDGNHFSKDITKYTPEWKLRYITSHENDQYILKPVWLLTAKELIDCEMDDNYTVMFDAENGNEIVREIQE